MWIFASLSTFLTLSFHSLGMSDRTDTHYTSCILWAAYLIPGFALLGLLGDQRPHLWYFNSINLGYFTINLTLAVRCMVFVRPYSVHLFVSLVIHKVMVIHGCKKEYGCQGWIDKWIVSSSLTLRGMPLLSVHELRVALWNFICVM